MYICPSYSLLNNFHDDSPYELGFKKRGRYNRCNNSVKTSERTTSGFKKKLYMVFIDYHKAFDMVNHEEMFNMINIPEYEKQLIIGLYAGAKLIVLRYNSKLGEKQQIGKGVLQGDALSPALFNVFIERILDKANIKGDEMGRKIPAELRYADDIVLIAESLDEMREKVGKVNVASKEEGMRINIRKTKAMTIGGEEGDITLEGESLEWVESFQYLGSNIDKTAGSSKEILRRIAIGKDEMRKMSRILKSKELSRKTKVTIIKTRVWSKMCYGCEAWTMTREDERRINAADMWVWRRMANIKWDDFRTNDKVREMTGTRDEHLMRAIKRRKCRFFGHVMRQKGIVWNLANTREVGGKRGRPSARWKSDVARWMGKREEEIVRETGNREAWKDMVERLPP